MSGSVPIRMIGRYVSFVLGIIGCVIVLSIPDIPAYVRGSIAACIAGSILLASLGVPDSTEAVRDLAGQARSLFDQPFPSSTSAPPSNDIAAIREAILDAAVCKRELDRVCVDMNDARQLAQLGQQAAGVAHELNNPLGGILMYANLIAEDTDPGDPAYANLGKIIRETERCRTIVKRLLDIARQAPPHVTVTRVETVLAEALSNIRPVAEKNAVTVHEDFQTPLPPVQADGCQLQEVFENLIKNAVEALDGPGEVFLAVRAVENGGAPGAVEITFADTGPGIAPEDLDHLFEPFYTTKRCGHGTGLGLSVSNSIIERHGGSITASNRPEGGASFTVRLPADGEAS